MKVDLTDYDVNLSAEEQKQKLWLSLVSHNSTVESEASSNGSCPHERKWPTYDSLVAHVAQEDYKKNLVCPYDITKNKDGKKICPHGVVACCKIEMFDFPTDRSSNNNNNPELKPYTGLFTPGQTMENCIVRLSSAIRPLDQGKGDWTRALVRKAVSDKLSKAKIVPGAAIKVFRSNNVPSGNLLFLGSKVGQREDDFFAHCLCTSMTEKMPSVALPFVRKFWRYSDYPLSLGVSDYAAFDEDGNDHRGDSHNFPFAVTLKPVLDRSKIEGLQEGAPTTDAKENRKSFATFDSFIDEVTNIPVGTVLFDIYATPDPDSVRDPTKIQRIGRIVTTSELMQSAPDDGIFFRHQLKEEDFALRPEWKKGINRKISMDEGKTKGTVSRLAGWRLFEEDIAEGKYVDFEKA